MINIGKKVRELREKAGISQQQLADLLNLKRPTVSQIENGERKLCAEDLFKLAEIFNTSTDYILGLRSAPEVSLPKGKQGKAPESDIRISVPQQNLDRFKEILLYILNKVGSKPNIGETVLYKLLYFIDFNFYEKFEEQLIGAKYIKNTYGPTPVEFKDIVEQMVEHEEITIVKSKYFKYPQRKYLPLRKEKDAELDKRAMDVIDEVLNRLSDMTAKQISEYSHGDVPWMTAEDGKVMEYESVFYRTPAYSVREQDNDVS